MAEQKQTPPGIEIVNGKEYHTVAKRVVDFWSDPQFADYSIRTKVETAAQLVRVKARIVDGEGRVRAEGTAEEERGAGQVNQRNAVENAETSAVGRALGMFGRGGIQIPTAEDMRREMERQEEDRQFDRLVKYNQLVEEHIESIVFIKKALAGNQYGTAYEAIQELPQEDWKALWRAYSKGGIWTPGERSQLKSNDMNAAAAEYHATEENGDDS